MTPTTLNPNITRHVVISASRYSTIQACFYRAHLRYNKKFYPVTKAEPLERGTLIDLLCQEFYRGKKAKLSFNECLENAIEKGRFSAVKMSLPVEQTEYLIERFIQYVHHYLNDDWVILEVQAPFTKLLYENEEQNFSIIGEGLIDLLVSNRGNILVVDTKSNSRQADEHKINVQKQDNQFKLYCIAFETNQICVNDFGVQKSKNEDILFQRRLINFNPEVLQEWVANCAYWVNSWLEHNEANCFPRNEASCYRCDYTKVCSEEPSMRQMIMDRDFVIKKEDFDIYGKS